MGILALNLQIPLSLIFVADFLVAALCAAVGLGLLRVENWARWLIIGLCTLELIMAAVGYAVPRFLLFRLGILGMAIDVAALIFLFLSKLKKYSKPTPTERGRCSELDALPQCA